MLLLIFTSASEREREGWSVLQTPVTTTENFMIVSISYKKVKFEVITAANMKMAVFWVVDPCSLVEVYRRFRGACCLNHHGATTQKTAIFNK
jgi:hypothetical protein